jgi:hypothetical protein
VGIHVVTRVRVCGVVQWLLCSRARRAVRAIEKLRRSYEYVLVMAAAEDALNPHYEAYVDALEILGGRAMWVANSF